MNIWTGYTAALATILAIDIIWFIAMVIQVKHHDHKNKH